MCICASHLTPYVRRQEDRIAEEKRKINDCRSECIAAFTHRGRGAKYSLSSPCSALLRAEGLSRDACRPEGAHLFTNRVRSCLFLSVMKYVDLDPPPLAPACPFPQFSTSLSAEAHLNTQLRFNLPPTREPAQGPSVHGSVQREPRRRECSVRTNGPLDSSVTLEREKEGGEMAPGTPGGAPSLAAPGAASPPGLLPLPCVPAERRQLTLHPPQQCRRCTSVRPFPRVRPSVCGRRMGLSFLCVCVCLHRVKCT